MAFIKVDTLWGFSSAKVARREQPYLLAYKRAIPAPNPAGRERKLRLVWIV
jgi:hypothetical protein